MKKYVIALNIVICFGLLSCNLTTNTQQDNTKLLFKKNIQQATNFISNDTVFRVC